MYRAALFNEPMPADIGAFVQNMQICEVFGWSLDYVNSLDEFILADIRGYISGMNRVKTAKSKAKK